MDPTLSPYGTPGTPPAQNNQLAMLLKQLLGNQQNQPGAGAGGPPQAGQPGQNAGQGGAQSGQDNSTFGGAGNVIKGLFNPPPTSILGQGITGVKNLFQGPSTTASPAPAGLGTYEGNIPSPANPAGPGTMGIMPSASSAVAPPSVTGGAGSMGGGATDPMSFAGPPTTMGAGNMGMDPGAGVNPFGFGGGANPAGPDAMTQALMAPPAMAANPAGFAGGANLADMLML